MDLMTLRLPIYRWPNTLRPLKAKLQVISGPRGPCVQPALLTFVAHI